MLLMITIYILLYAGIRCKCILKPNLYKIYVPSEMKMLLTSVVMWRRRIACESNNSNIASNIYRYNEAMNRQTFMADGLIQTIQMYARRNQFKFAIILFEPSDDMIWVTKQFKTCANDIHTQPTSITALG